MYPSYFHAIRQEWNVYKTTQFEVSKSRQKRTTTCKVYIFNALWQTYDILQAHNLARTMIILNSFLNILDTLGHFKHSLETNNRDKYRTASISAITIAWIAAARNYVTTWLTAATSIGTILTSIEIV